MRRILLLLAVAAVVLAAAASSALAQATPTGSNCYGANQSGNVAGQGGLPGSPQDPAPGFTDPRDNISPTWNGPVTSFFGNPKLAPGTDSPSVLTDFQHANRDLSAGTSPDANGTCPTL